ncbi:MULTISPECIES: guanitoxin biosynthesis MBL fold metallo-hydrolase GntH [Rhodococcus]|uniref:Putative ribonuclease Z n=1 Tax=Rhodococcus ruber BKS 20-38 TaxID=1278076 RepID=M2YNW2_9NOCA|nr:MULTISPECIES: guanitoxin biosynthesis MBL fold metallo-hydrolase GntH [Rhodococcus]EME63615.1 putative ribonuclease Z [Rhodococcus ruber BKS 20-38]
MAAESNAYGAPPGTGISMPPYYQPTPSVKNRNNYIPQTEPLGPDEMRIIFMGSNPWPPRMSQASTCMMVELGPAKRLFFDLGPGSVRNIVANQVPVPEINDIFISHLHIDHYGDLPYLWQFAPFNGRFKPLRVIGPSGRTPEMGTAAMCDHLKKMGAWTAAWAIGPMADGYDIEVTEFDFRDDGGVCYDRDGVKVTHWRRSHAIDGASAYRLDWNGLSFVWTGDGKPDRLTAEYAQGVDVFVTEMAVDLVNLWALKQGVSPVMAALTLDNFHTSHYGAGYLANLVRPRLAMATHVSYDRELVGEMLAGVRLHYKGMFAFGIDHTVVNVTKDHVWIREAAFPETTNIVRPSPEWLLHTNFDDELPEPSTVTNPFFANQEQSVRDLEIDPALFTPEDQMRPFARPTGETLPMDPAMTLGLPRTPPPESA